MKIKSLIYVFAIIAMIIPMSCTHNDGDIGDWFGQWKLTEIKIDGSTDTQYKGNIFWAFQSSVLQMTKAVNDVNFQGVWASWSENGNILKINFINHENAPENDFRYVPFDELHLPQAVCDLEVVKLDGKHIVLKYESSDGHCYTYYFDKWG